MSSSWTDEFYDFTSSKRGSHRRAVSDSMTFFESASVQPHDDVALINFDRLVGKELMSFFSDELEPLSSAPPSTAPSTPSSDQNSIGDQDKQTPPNSSSNDQSDAQSASISAETPGAAVAVSAANTTSILKTPQHIVDPKKAKRYISQKKKNHRWIINL